MTTIMISRERAVMWRTARRVLLMMIMITPFKTMMMIIMIMIIMTMFL